MQGVLHFHAAVFLNRLHTAPALLLLLEHGRRGIYFFILFKDERKSVIGIFADFKLSRHIFYLLFNIQNFIFKISDRCLYGYGFSYFRADQRLADRAFIRDFAVGRIRLRKAYDLVNGFIAV